MTPTVRRITISLVIATFGIYLGLIWWWSTPAVMAEAATRPERALDRFDTSNAIIPWKKILAGGPAPDAIPSIDKPKFVDVDAADFVRSEDDVIVHSANDETRIYPFCILVWHEIVNDQIGEHSFAVTYCPLCGTAMVFDRELNGEVLEFGVSGLLFNSDVLLFDRQSESLWTQLGRKSVSGKHVGKKLTWLPSKQMTWASARTNYPNAQVLSLETGHKRTYEAEAYAAYKKSPKNSFPVDFEREELERKEWVLGIEVNGVAKAYAISQLKEIKQIDDVVGQAKIRISYDPESQLALVTDPQTKESIPSVRSYWFAWQAFYPKTEVWEGNPHEIDSGGR